MADQALKAKIREVLKKGYFNDPDDWVDISDGADDDFVHVVVISRKFEGQRAKDRSDLLWSQFSKGLSPEEWGHISLSVARSPEEVKAS